MNTSIENQLKHRTIREFKDEKLDESLVNKLLEVANRSASSNGMQFFSIINVTDQAIKDQLAENGGQEYMARAPHLWIFVADLYRNYNIAKENGQENDEMIGFDKFIQADRFNYSRSKRHSRCRKFGTWNKLFWKYSQ